MVIMTLEKSVEIQDRYGKNKSFADIRIIVANYKTLRTSRCTCMCILLLPSSSGQLLHLHIVCAGSLLLDAVFALVLGLPLCSSSGVT